MHSHLCTCNMYCKHTYCNMYCNMHCKHMHSHSCTCYNAYYNTHSELHVHTHTHFWMSHIQMVHTHTLLNVTHIMVQYIYVLPCKGQISAQKKMCVGEQKQNTYMSNLVNAKSPHTRSPRGLKKTNVSATGKAKGKLKVPYGVKSKKEHLLLIFKMLCRIKISCCIKNVDFHNVMLYSKCYTINRLIGFETKCTPNLETKCTPNLESKCYDVIKMLCMN